MMSGCMNIEDNVNNWFGYWLAVKRRWLEILLVSVVAAVAAYGVVAWRGETYEVYFSYLISLKEQQVKDDFQFDGYYALQATDLFTTTLAAWTTRPEVVVRAYERAGVELPGRSARQISQGILAEKMAPQLIGVTVRHADKNKAMAIAQALQAVMEENVEQYHAEGIPALRFAVVGTVPWQGVSRLETRVIVGAVFVFVFLLAVNAVLLRESMSVSNVKLQNPNVPATAGLGCGRRKSNSKSK